MPSLTSPLDLWTGLILSAGGLHICLIIAFNNLSRKKSFLQCLNFGPVWFCLPLAWEEANRAVGFSILLLWVGVFSLIAIVYGSLLQSSVVIPQVLQDNVMHYQDIRDIQSRLESLNKSSYYNSQTKLDFFLGFSDNIVAEAFLLSLYCVFTCVIYRVLAIVFFSLITSKGRHFCRQKRRAEYLSMFKRKFFRA